MSECQVNECIVVTISLCIFTAWDSDKLWHVRHRSLTERQEIALKARIAVMRFVSTISLKRGLIS